MSRKSENQIDMLHGPLLKRMVLFALPLMASSILQLLFTMTDTAVVGRFAGHEAMAAVGANMPLINLLVSLFIGLSVGVNVVIARFIGQRRWKQLPQAVYTTVIMALVCGLLLMVAGLLLAEPLLQITGVPAEVMDMAALYLRIYFLGTPFLILYNFCSSILRSKGDSRRPLYILFCGGVINVALNLLLVIVFHLSVAGVAIGTAASDLVSGLLILWILRRESEEYRLRFRGMRPSRRVIWDIIRIGLPAGLQGMVFALSNTVIQSAVNSLGTPIIAGNAAALNFDAIGYFAINAFNQAAVTFTSQNYGAGEYKRCDRIFWTALACGTASCLALNLLCAGLQDQLLVLFTTNGAALAAGKIRMTRVLTMQSIAGSYEIAGSCMRGMGHSLTPTLIVIFGSCVLRVVWVMTVFRSMASFEGLLMVYPVTWLVTGVLTLIAYALLRRRVFSADL